ncbi:MAG: hypothetical protein AAF944_09865 [Bacteroidota bacterium]
MAFIVVLVAMMACQSSSQSETVDLYSETGSADDIKSLENLPVTPKELLLEKARRVQQLQEQFRVQLDSLYALDSIPVSPATLDSVERIFFALTDAETAWVTLRYQYPDQFDSTSIDSKNTQSPQFDSTLEFVLHELDRSIERAERCCKY